MILNQRRAFTALNPRTSLITDRLNKLPEKRKIKNARMVLTNNLRGLPHANIAAVAIIRKD